MKHTAHTHVEAPSRLWTCAGLEENPRGEETTNDRPSDGGRLVGRGGVRDVSLARGTVKWYASCEPQMIQTGGEALQSN